MTQEEIKQIEDSINSIRRGEGDENEKLYRKRILDATVKAIETVKDGEITIRIEPGCTHIVKLAIVAGERTETIVSTVYEPGNVN